MTNRNALHEALEELEWAAPEWESDDGNAALSKKAVKTIRTLLEAAIQEKPLTDTPQGKCPHNRIDHNLECLDCDEPVYGEP